VDQDEPQKDGATATQISTGNTPNNKDPGGERVQKLSFVRSFWSAKIGETGHVLIRKVLKFDFNGEGRSETQEEEGLAICYGRIVS